MNTMQGGERGGSGSIYEVARKAGVSIVTVSRVFNDYPHVSARMRDRVFAASRDIGYTPRMVSKPKVVAVIVETLEQLRACNHLSSLVMHLVRHAAKSNLLLDFIPVSALEKATKRLVDGMIDTTPEPGIDEAWKQLPNVPTVVINKVPARDHWTMIGSDHFLETSDAATHLIRNGHEQIALVLDTLKGWRSEERIRGFRKAMSSVQRPNIHPLLETRGHHLPAIADRMISHGCTALLNFSEEHDLELLDILKSRHRLSIPGDLSVISIEKESFSPYYQPSLTTISQPLSEIAEQCIEFLVESGMDSMESHHKNLVIGRLIERTSVAPLRARTLSVCETV